MLVMGNELCVTRHILFNGSFEANKKQADEWQTSEGEQ